MSALEPRQERAGVRWGIWAQDLCDPAGHRKQNSSVPDLTLNIQGQQCVWWLKKLGNRTPLVKWEVSLSKRAASPLTPIARLVGGAHCWDCKSSNSLEGLTELTESCYTHSHGYDSERGQTKNESREEHIEQSPGYFQMQSFQLPCPRGAGTGYFPSIEVWQYAWSSANQGSLARPRNLILSTWLSAHVAALSLQCLQRLSW
jgi:hypothetical protein